MFNKVERYVQACPRCQRHKELNKSQTATIEPTGPWDRVGLDFIGPLEETQNGNRYIIVAMDYLTRWPEARATPWLLLSRPVNFYMKTSYVDMGLSTAFIQTKAHIL